MTENTDRARNILIKKDKLGCIVRDLVCAKSRNRIVDILAQYMAEEKCKEYSNIEQKLPKGAYLEINPDREKERVVFDKITFRVFVTRDHYCTFYYAGKPKFYAPQNL